MPWINQLEPLGHGRVVGLALGERADAGRVVDHEDRPDERLLDLRFEDFALDDVGMLAGRFEAERFRDLRPPPPRRSASMSSVLGEQFVVGLAGKRRREVDRRVAPGKLERLAGGMDRVDDAGLGQVHHRAVVAVGLVGFEHREFGVVLLADPLVAIDAAKLVHAFDAADHQPLQMQFQRDPQVEVDVERVVVRFERPGGGAAGDRVQRRTFHFDEAPAWLSVSRIERTIFVRCRNRCITPSPYVKSR